MLTKKSVQSQLAVFPDEFTIDQLVDRLILIEKIEKGISQSENGEIMPDSGLDKELEKWFK